MGEQIGEQLHQDHPTHPGEILLTASALQSAV